MAAGPAAGGGARPARPPGAAHQSCRWPPGRPTRLCRGGRLVFVGAAGIAVRAVAPYVEKQGDGPGRGGGGRSAAGSRCRMLCGPPGRRQRSGPAHRRPCCGAQPVITTATDANGACSPWTSGPRGKTALVLDVARGIKAGVRKASGRARRWPCAARLAHLAGTPPERASRAVPGRRFDVALTVTRPDDGAGCASCRASRCWGWAAGRGTSAAGDWRRPSTALLDQSGAVRRRRFVRCAPLT